MPLYHSLWYRLCPDTVGVAPIVGSLQREKEGARDKEREETEKAEERGKEGGRRDRGRRKDGGGRERGGRRQRTGKGGRWRRERGREGLSIHTYVQVTLVNITYVRMYNGLQLHTHSKGVA